MKTELHRAVLGALMVSILAGCTFAAPAGLARVLRRGRHRPRPARRPTAPDPDATAPDATPTATAPQTPKPTATTAPTPEPTEQAEHPGPRRPAGHRRPVHDAAAGRRLAHPPADGRTDTIMFVTIDPNTGKVSMASLPRDMVFVPIGPGKTFGSGYTRINALFAYLGGFGGGRKATSSSAWSRPWSTCRASRSTATR